MYTLSKKQEMVEHIYALWQEIETEYDKALSEGINDFRFDRIFGQHIAMVKLLEKIKIYDE